MADVIRATRAGPADVPLVVHVLYRFDCGGMQTLIAECINRMPARRYRHAVVTLAGWTDYAERICADGVKLYSLDKARGRAWARMRSCGNCCGGCARRLSTPITSAPSNTA